METKPSTLQYNLSYSYQNNTGEMEGENMELFRRLNFNPSIKVTPQAVDFVDHFFSLKSRLMTLSFQIYNNIEEMLSISRLELPNLINGGYYD